MNDQPSYPVTLTVDSPEQYERVQLLVRLIVIAALGMFHQSLLGILAALYLLLPGVAAILISRRGDGFSYTDANWIAKALDWLLAFYAYMSFVTDSFPLDTQTRNVRLRVETRGQPTIRDALLRLVTGLPHALVLAVLAVVSGLISTVIGLFVLLTRRAPRALRGFQQSVLRWLARFFAYHASLVDVYPPFGSIGVDVTPPSTGAV